MSDEKGEPERDSAAFVASTYARMQETSKGLPFTRKIYGRASNGPEQGDNDTVQEDHEAAPWRPPPGVARSKTGAGYSRWDPQALGSVVGAMTRRRSWQGPLSLGTVILQWPQIVGANVASHSQIESFEDGKLLVRADSSAWAKQLQLLLPQIEKRVADVLGVNAVRQVIVHGPQRPSWKHGKFTVKGKGPRDTYG